MNAERRPRAAQETAASSLQSTIRESTDIGAQLRARRAASWRLPLLQDGRRDPLETENTISLVMENTISLGARRLAWLLRGAA